MMDELKDYLLKKPIIDGEQFTQSRVYGLMMIPGQLSAMMNQLSAPMMAQVLEIGKDDVSAILHQLLLLDKDDFKQLINKLDHRDVLKLFAAQDDMGNSFLKAAVDSADLRLVTKEYILSKSNIEEFRLLKTKLYDPHAKDDTKFTDNEFNFFKKLGVQIDKKEPKKVINNRLNPKSEQSDSSSGQSLDTQKSLKKNLQEMKNADTAEAKHNRPSNK